MKSSQNSDCTNLPTSYKRKGFFIDDILNNKYKECSQTFTASDLNSTRLKRIVNKDTAERSKFDVKFEGKKPICGGNTSSMDISGDNLHFTAQTKANFANFLSQDFGFASATTAAYLASNEDPNLYRHRSRLLAQVTSTGWPYIAGFQNIPIETNPAFFLAGAGKSLCF